MSYKFRTQLTMTIAFIVLSTVALISLLANFFIHLEFEEYAKEQQKSYVNNLVTNLTHQFNEKTGNWNVEYVHGIGMSALYDGYLIQLKDSNGGLVWDAEHHDMAACSQVMHDIIERMEQKRPGLNGGIVSQEVRLQENQVEIGSLVLRYYGPYFLSESDYHFLDSLNLVLAVIGCLSLLCSLIAGGYLAKRISRPVINTAQMATQIAEGNYTNRLEGQTNIFELDQLIAAVNDMAASLDSQEGLRKRLTTDVAHELRTPLAAVSSHLEAMMEGVWQPTPERLESCYEEIGRLSGLVSDLERLAKVEHDNLNLEKTDVDLLELAHTVVGNFEMESAKKRISLHVDGAESHVLADKDRLHQVLANLLSNAIKYSAEGCSIRVAVSDTPERGILTVEDNGMGIPEKDLPFIFERFYRTDHSRSRLTGGAGIGLAIVKSIVSAHGGTVKAESSVGHGSRFIVSLPK